MVGGCCLPGLEAVAGSGSEVVARTLKNWAREEGGDSRVVISPGGHEAPWNGRWMENQSKRQCFS